MSRLRPFKAWHYNTQKLSLSDMVTPPYDVISDKEKEAYLSSSPYNFAHLICTSANQDYSRVTSRLNSWHEQGVLQEDGTDHYYIYQQQFQAEGRLHTRTTFVCALKLEHFKDGNVRPHEKTHAGPADDRYQILKQTGFNLTSVFAMAKDEEGVLLSTIEETIQKEPWLQAKTADGIAHAVWQITADKAAPIVEHLSQAPIYIVDGHHRYSSALRYADDHGVTGKDEPASYMSFAIASLHDPALLVYPTHRKIKNLSLGPELRQTLAENFECEEFPQDQMEAFTTEDNDKSSFLLLGPGGCLKCTPRSDCKTSFSDKPYLGALSVVWSDQHLLPTVFGISESERGDRIDYFKSYDKLIQSMTDQDVAVILPPIALEAITAVGDAGDFLPQKTTYFYPKVGAGLVLRRLQWD